jgi:sigma-E factor negative regulatory protein RseA
LEFETMKYVEDTAISINEQLSALHDGQLSATEAAALVRASLNDESLMQQWRSMSAIGHVLREQQSGLAMPPADVAVDCAQAQVAQPKQELPVAANDGVFRWKMLAGVAAFAAVGSLAWALLGAAGPSRTGGELAQASSTNSSIVANAPVAANAPGQGLIAVGVGQIAGQEATMIRDPRLDELLAAHRQFGGVSALQQPAGSLRSASLTTLPR